MPYNELNAKEAKVIDHKGTEPAFRGQYNNFYINGFYTCRKCSIPLYRSIDKFRSNCGWPSFDDEIPGRVKRQQDVDGIRTEIVCCNCQGHLSHIFEGERYTDKNTRHCVNSISLKFLSTEQILSEYHQHEKTIDVVVVAGGCFWGVEYFFEQEPGVLATAPGYVGGDIDHPTYQQVCSGKTGHAEAVVIIFDKRMTDTQKLYQLFFNIHDSSQANRQGPDIGDQYRSAIFTRHPEQTHIAQQVIAHYPKATTQIAPLDKFWIAETEHHHYYRNRGTEPYCHFKRDEN